MRRDVVWPDTVSGWCFWASLVALVAVIGVSLAAPVVVAAHADEAVEILWKVAQFGFAAVVGLFLLGIVCGRIEEIRRNSNRG